MSIDFYKEFGDLGYLANYSNHGFYKDGVYYKTVEHYYQSQKYNNDQIKNKIINAETPKEASTIGRDKNNIRIDNFKNIKNDIMYDGVLEKFRQNKDIRSKLIETRNKEIREMTIDEYYWGVGKDFTGKNTIGKILMKVREQIKEELLDEIINNCKNKKIYIISHHKPDADSIISTILLNNILKSFGIDSISSIRDNNIIDKDLVNDYIDDKLEVIDNLEDKYFILVDHNNLDGINKNNVIASIDHHRITNEVEDIIEIEYASCALLIYDLFKNKYKFNNKEKELIALSVLSDTEYLNSSRFTEEDKVLYEELNIDININDIRNKYFKVTDFNNEISKNLKEDYKEYIRNNNTIKRSIIKSYSKEKDIYYNIYVNEMENNNIDLLIWCDYESKKTYIHYKENDIIFPYFTTSSNLILDSFEDDNNKIKVLK